MTVLRMRSLTHYDNDNGSSSMIACRAVKQTIYVPSCVGLEIR